MKRRRMKRSPKKNFMLPDESDGRKDFDNFLREEFQKPSFKKLWQQISNQ